MVGPIWRCAGHPPLFAEEREISWTSCRLRARVGEAPAPGHRSGSAVINRDRGLQMRAEIISRHNRVVARPHHRHERLLAGPTALPSRHRCYYISQLGDNLGRLTDHLRRAWDRSELIVMTGGLDPTEDDLTREAISALLQEPMVVQPDLETELRAFSPAVGRACRRATSSSGHLIRKSARVLQNPVGTAPGWWWSGTGGSSWLHARRPRRDVPHVGAWKSSLSCASGDGGAVLTPLSRW